ncbi:MAG: ANTAR domain-containing protein [Actinomycetota bacterium]
MDTSRISRIVDALAQGGHPLDVTTYPQRVCSVGVDLLGMTGAGLTLMGGGDLGAVWASDELVGKIEEVQLGLGEGPGLDAFALGAPILEPDLGGPSTRWPFFRQAALDLGVGALFVFPLQMGVIAVGVLTLYRREAGFLSDEQLADALTLADVATQDLLDLEDQGDIPWGETDVRGQRAQVHQATGMVAAQLNSSMANAMARLRAHAFSTGSTIYRVAEEVLSRRLRLDGTSE